MPRSISLAMIVKDEAEHVEECLASVASVVNEICLVDTGSRDNTVEIARRYNAKVSFYIWCDDFAAARNESLRCCTQDWVFVLDADERVAPEDLSAIRSLTEGPSNVSYRFVTRNYTNTETVSEFHRCEPGDPNARGFSGWYPSAKVRFFPNNVGARFEGRVHELVHESLEHRGIKTVLCDVPVHHYPYTRSPARLLEKQELYLHLGLQKVQANPGDPKAYAELGDQYAEVRDYASAAAAYRESLKIDPSNPVVMKDLGGMLHLLKRSDEAKSALKIALDLDPSLPEGWRNLGVVYADEKSWPLAVDCFTQAVSLNPSWGDGHRYLSVALEGAGRLADAAAEARKALEANPGSADSLSLYIHQMLRLEQRPKAREFLSSLVQDGVQNPEIHNALGELCYYDGLYEAAKSHFLTAGQAGIASAYNNLGVVLYMQKHYAEAKTAFENCLRADPLHRGARTNLDKTLDSLNARNGHNGGGES